jgi:hypothetical protein
MVKENEIRKWTDHNTGYNFFVVTKIFKKAGNDWCSCRELKNGTIYDLGYHYIENYSVVMDG